MMMMHRRVGWRLTTDDSESGRWWWNVVEEEFAFVSIEEIRGHMEGEIDHVKELELQEIEFSGGDSANASIIGIIVVGVVKELCSDHDASDEQAMDIERGEEEAGILLNDAIQIDDGQDEALRAAVGILHEPFQIGLDRDGRRTTCVEHSQLGRVQRGLVIALSDLAQHTREGRHKLLDIQFIRIGKSRDCLIDNMILLLLLLLLRWWLLLLQLLRLMSMRLGRLHHRRRRRRGGGGRGGCGGGCVCGRGQ